VKRSGGQAQFSAALQAGEDRFGALHDWIGTHLAADLSLPAPAARASMSERGFSRRYLDAIGSTPTRAVEAMRVERAPDAFGLPLTDQAHRRALRLRRGGDDAAELPAAVRRAAAGRSRASQTPKRHVIYTVPMGKARRAEQREHRVDILQRRSGLGFERQLLHYKSTLDSNLEAWKATQLAGFKATLDFGRGASKGVFLLNVAGALALLAFMGSSKATEQHLAALATSLAAYATGAMCAVLCMGLAYVAQALFTMGTRKGYRSRWFWGGTAFQLGAAAISVASVCLFFTGLQCSAAAFVPKFSMWALFWLSPSGLQPANKTARRCPRASSD
jgi:hypothetical protein